MPGAFTLVEAAYPPAETVRLGFTPTPLRVYTGKPVVRLKLKAPPGTAQTRRVRLGIRYQACNDRVCQRAVETIVEGQLQVAAGK